MNMLTIFIVSAHIFIISGSLVYFLNAPAEGWNRVKETWDCRSARGATPQPPVWAKIYHLVIGFDGPVPRLCVRKCKNMITTDKYQLGNTAAMFPDRIGAAAGPVPPFCPIYFLFLQLVPSAVAPHGFQ